MPSVSWYKRDRTGLGFYLEPMSFREQYLLKFEKTANSKNLTKEQSLAEEIWLYFGKSIHFARIMRDIKRKGYQFIFEIFQEVKKSEAKDKKALFIWKIKQCLIIYEK